MDYFVSGPREIVRMCVRQGYRLRLRTDHRKLAEAETELGLLGWQQADYDDATQREVDKIKNYEMDQSRMTNESAELAREIQTLIDEREGARREFEEQMSQLKAHEAAVRTPLDELESRLEELRKQERGYEKRFAEIDREIGQVDELYRNLLISGVQSAEVRDEMLRLREKAVELPNEKTDLRAQQMRTTTELRNMTPKTERRRAELEVIVNQQRELESEFGAQDRERASFIRSKEREKVALNKQIDALEFAKANPYQQIGHVLANCHIAPMNQPQALDKVYALRFKVQQADEAVAKSLAATQAVSKKTLRASIVLWSVIFLTLGFLVCTMLLKQHPA